ncbi:MAG TPA: nucleotidyltransferase family protein [Thermoanaerobaculia bacterium]|nr:nucleotidyltransferase family protein [Thermoanaerobaculia bacterium]
MTTPDARDDAPQIPTGSMSGSAEVAVILAAGRGTRMQKPDADAHLDPAQAAAAAAGLKAMIPVDGRPFLDYVLSRLADAGMKEICLVVAPGYSPIREHYEESRPSRFRLAFAVQAEPLGTAHALLSAEAFTAKRDFLALNSDNYYPLDAYRALRDLGEPGLPVFDRETLLAKSNFPRERVAKYAVLGVGRDGYLERIVEKPTAGELAGDEVLLSMNLWRFAPRIFEACRCVPLSGRGERELPQAVQWAISNLGARFRAVRCEGGVLDLSARADVESVAERLRGVPVRL